jgi:hypothetical protein
MRTDRVKVLGASLQLSTANVPKNEIEQISQ